MKVEDIKNLIVPEQFGINDCGSEETASMEEVMDQLPSAIVGDCAWGVSKFVIFPDEDKDVVVKLPFTGTFYDIWNDDIKEYNEGFEYFNPKYDNYCAMEADIYAQAEEEGVAEFFASTEYAGKTASDTPYYVSEKVYGFYDEDVKDSRVTPSNDSVKKAQNTWCAVQSSQWLAEAFEWYGEGKTNKFLRFLEEHNINDLHNGNVGFRKDGSPVLLDYSGYYWD